MVYGWIHHKLHAWNTLSSSDQPNMSRAFQKFTRCELRGHRSATLDSRIPFSARRVS